MGTERHQMSLEINRSTVFVDMRLTSLGRQLASLGRLRFRRAVLSDSEMDYSFESPYYDLSDNFVISPFDTAQNIPTKNFDGSPGIMLGPKNLIRGRENDELEIFDQPFFLSSSTRTAIDVSKCIAIGTTSVSNMLGTSYLPIQIMTVIDPPTLDYTTDTVDYERCVGNLIMVRHHATTTDRVDHFGEQPLISLWYRINAWDGSGFSLDRALPNFAAGSDDIMWFVYPWSGSSPYATGSTATTESLFLYCSDYSGPLRKTGQTGPSGYDVYSFDGSPITFPPANEGVYYDTDHWVIYAFGGFLVYEAAVGTESDPSFVTDWGTSPASKPVFAAHSNGAGTKPWGMHIVRTINEVGATGATSGYTTYGSIQYGGTKNFFGFDADQRAVGFIYLNEELDVDRQERLQLSSTTLYAPTILWHRKPEYISGRGTKGGHSFTDCKSKLYYDSVAQLPYSKLMDGADANAIEVGRVYHDLCMVVITHQEMLTAMTFKSNRNWTLPPLKLSLEEPYVAGTTGLCKSNKTYLATYVMTESATYSSASSFSYRTFAHCGHISRIDGVEGGPYALMARLANNHFPYMRTAGKIEAFSGTGWNANNFYILVKEINKTEFSGISSVTHSGWKRLTTGGEYSNQNFESTISPSGLTAYQFTITQGDYNAGAAYTLGSLNGDQFDRTFSGLSYGDETFFYGSIEYDLNKDPEKVSIKFPMMPNDFNSTMNTTYGPDNESTYVTGIYIMDDLDRVVAVAKPSGPIKKNYGRYIEFKLDLIY